MYGARFCAQPFCSNVRARNRAREAYNLMTGNKENKLSVCDERNTALQVSFCIQYSDQGKHNLLMGPEKVGSVFHMGGQDTGLLARGKVCLMCVY